MHGNSSPDCWGETSTKSMCLPGKQHVSTNSICLPYRGYPLHSAVSFSEDNAFEENVVSTIIAMFSNGLGISLCQTLVRQQFQPVRWRFESHIQGLVGSKTQYLTPYFYTCPQRPAL